MSPHTPILRLIVLSMVLTGSTNPLPSLSPSPLLHPILKSTDPILKPNLPASSLPPSLSPFSQRPYPHTQEALCSAVPYRGIRINKSPNTPSLTRNISITIDTVRPLIHPARSTTPRHNIPFLFPFPFSIRFHSSSNNPLISSHPIPSSLVHLLSKVPSRTPLYIHGIAYAV